MKYYLVDILLNFLADTYHLTGEHAVEIYLPKKMFERVIAEARLNLEEFGAQEEDSLHVFKIAGPKGLCSIYKSEKQKRGVL